MENFSFYNPTRIELGKGKEENIGQYIAGYGVTKVLIVYGSERIKKNSLREKVAKSLSINGISYDELAGVQSNPILNKVYEGIDAGIEALKLWYSQIGTPVTVKEGSIPESDIPMLVEKLTSIVKMLGAEASYFKK